MLCYCYIISKTRQTIDFLKIIKRTICHYMRYDRNRHAHRLRTCDFFSLPDIKSPSFRICPHLPLIFTLCDLLFLEATKKWHFSLFFGKISKIILHNIFKAKKKCSSSDPYGKNKNFSEFLSFYIMIQTS